LGGKVYAVGELGGWGGRRWLGPVELADFDPLPRKPGLYALVAYRRSQPCAIGRFLGNDASGLVYIGKATRVRGRVRSLALSYLEGKRGHMAGRNLERVDALRAKAGLPTVRSDYELRLFYTLCPSPLAAEKAETKLLHWYIAQFGEVPPMNAQGSWVSIQK